MQQLILTQPPPPIPTPNTKLCLKGIGEWGAPERQSREKQSITWELIIVLKTDLV